MKKFLLVSDNLQCRYNHSFSKIDKLLARTISTNEVINSSSSVLTHFRIVVVDLCRTNLLPAVIAGLTLRNKGCLVIFDLCSDNPSALINDLYNPLVEMNETQRVRGDAVIAEAALHLSAEIVKAVHYFEDEFL